MGIVTEEACDRARIPMIEMKVCRKSQHEAVEGWLAGFHFLLHLRRMPRILVKAVPKQRIDQYFVTPTLDRHSFICQIRDLHLARTEWEGCKK